MVSIHFSVQNWVFAKVTTMTNCLANCEAVIFLYNSIVIIPIFFQIQFINIAWGLPSVARLLNCQNVLLERKWDVCKALQHFIFYNDVPEELNLALTMRALETCSFAELVIRHHVFSVMLVIARQQECELGSNESQLNDFTAQLECTVNCMYKHLATATLISWLTGREEGTVNRSG